MNLDLNAKRAARAAARGEGLFIELGEDKFEIVGELPLEMEELRSDNSRDVLKMLLVNPDDLDRLLAHKLSFQDVLDIVEFYGVQLGESVSAVESSISTSAQSKRTGRGSTAASSRKTSGAQRPLAAVDSSA